MKLKVLYVEDDLFLSHIVSNGLESSGYSVTVIADGNQVIGNYHAIKPDICILDIMLPSKDGYRVATELKGVQPNLPVIFLSAKVLTEDIVKGFRSGGDDYLKKPFSMEELLVRMEALVLRLGNSGKNAADDAIIYFGNCRLDTIKQSLTTTSGQHSLSFKESALLEMMILSKNNILKRQDALFKVWGDDNYYNTRSMDVFMTHLRKLLKDEPGIQIMNVRGVGYKLIC